MALVEGKESQGGGSDLNFSKGGGGCIVTLYYRSFEKEFPVEFFDAYLFFAGASPFDVAIAQAHRGGCFVIAPGVNRATVDLAKDVAGASGQVEVSGIRSGN